MKPSLKFVLTAILLAMTAHHGSAAQQPNVLFIAIDDLKPLLGCYQVDWIHSPNIDGLARRGTVFASCYCQQALCGPSRVSLLTGLRPDTTGIYGMGSESYRMRTRAPDVVTLPAHFTSHGYITRAIGKIFDSRNFDKGHDAVSWSESYLLDKDGIYDTATGKPSSGYQNPVTKQIASRAWKLAAQHDFKTNRQRREFLETIEGSRPAVECMDVPDNAYHDGAMALRAVQEIHKLASRGKPFFFAVGFHKPHLPFVAPKQYWDLYQRDQLPLAENANYPAGSPTIAHTVYVEGRTYHGVPTTGAISEAIQRELVHGYVACVSYVDAQVGKLLVALEEAGIAENTVVCLWGDHGWHLGDKGLWGKHTNYEQATRAPLIIHAPTVSGGTKTKAICEFVDIYPTLCELSGIPKPEPLEGVSLLPLMRDPQASVKELAISQYPRSGDMGWAIRNQRFRYVQWRKRSGKSKAVESKTNDVFAEELYDYEKDPLELRNLANDKAYAATRVKMAKLLEQGPVGDFLTRKGK